MSKELKPGEYIAFDGTVFTSLIECIMHERRVQLVMLGFSPELSALLVEEGALVLQKIRKIRAILAWPGPTMPPIFRRERRKSAP